MDPRLLVVVAARPAAHGGPCHAAGFSAPIDRGAAVADILVLAVDSERRQITAADSSHRTRILLTASISSTATPAPRVERRIDTQRPMLARLARFVEAALPGP